MLAIGLTPLVLLLGTFGALAMSGRSSVNEHVGQVIAAHNELEATLETEAEVITELAGLGISRSELDSQWSSWQSSTGTNRQVRVEVMARVLRKVLEQNEPPAGSSRVHLARKASGRLDRIDAALVELDDASDALDDASRGFTARLAIAFGLASNDY